MKLSEWHERNYQIDEWDFEITYGSVNHSINSSMGMVDRAIINYLSKHRVKISLSVKDIQEAFIQHRHWYDCIDSSSSAIHYICQTTNYLPPKNVKKALRRQSSLKLTACDYTAAELSARGIKCGVLHHGTQTELLKIPDRQNRKFTFLTIAQDAPFKGLKFGVDAFRIFHQRFPDSQYIIVSNGMADPKLSGISVLREMGHEDLFTLYSQCHVYICTSLWESFCNPLFEASCSGMYIISNDIPIVRSNFYQKRFSIHTVESTITHSTNYLLNSDFAPNNASHYDTDDFPIFHLPVIEDFVSKMCHAYENYTEYPIQKYSWDNVLDEEGFYNIVRSRFLENISNESFKNIRQTNIQSSYLSLIPHRSHSVNISFASEQYILQRKNSNTSLVCNNIAAWVWEHINGQDSIADIISKAVHLFSAQYRIQIKKDVIHLIDHFKAGHWVYLSYFNFTIAMIAIGKRYNDWALATIESLRRNGKFDGVIHVVTDTSENFHHFKDVVTISDTEPGTRIGIKTCKTRLLSLIPDEDILYIDVDVVCGSALHNIDVIFQASKKSKELLLFKDTGNAGSPYHAGVMLIRQHAHSLMHRWNSVIRQNAKDGCDLDQPALAIILTENKFDYLPTEFLVFPDEKYLREKKVNLFVHFTFTYRQQVIPHYLIRDYLTNTLQINHTPSNLVTTE